MFVDNMNMKICVSVYRIGNSYNDTDFKILQDDMKKLMNTHMVGNATSSPSLSLYQFFPPSFHSLPFFLPLLYLSLSPVLSPSLSSFITYEK